MLYKLVAKVIIFFSVYTLFDLVRQFIVKFEQGKREIKITENAFHFTLVYQLPHQKVI
jgi:hypothetical protein